MGTRMVKLKDLPALELELGFSEGGLVSEAKSAFFGGSIKVYHEMKFYEKVFARYKASRFLSFQYHSCEKTTIPTVVIERFASGSCVIIKNASVLCAAFDFLNDRNFTLYHVAYDDNENPVITVVNSRRTTMELDAEEELETLMNTEIPVEIIAFDSAIDAVEKTQEILDEMRTNVRVNSFYLSSKERHPAIEFQLAHFNEDDVDFQFNSQSGLAELIPATWYTEKDHPLNGFYSFYAGGDWNSGNGIA